MSGGAAGCRVPRRRSARARPGRAQPEAGWGQGVAGGRAVLYGPDLRLRRLGALDFLLGIVVIVLRLPGALLLLPVLLAGVLAVPPSVPLPAVRLRDALLLGAPPEHLQDTCVLGGGAATVPLPLSPSLLQQGRCR